MDCCNYMDYQLHSIYNYNRSQYNEGGYNSGYHQPAGPYFSSPYNHGYDNYHYQPHHMLHHFNDYNPGSYHYNDHDRSGTPALTGYQYHPPPPPPLPPWGSNGSMLGGATDYSYNPKEARARKAQREAIKSAQRQASNTVHSSPQHPHVGYRSSINSSSRPEMSPNTPFIPTYPPSPNLGQNRGSLSGGGIINASTPRPPAVSTPKRRPPPPPYPGQRNFHSMDSSREFSMGYGESGFSSLPTIYPSNQNGPQSEHQPGMFDIRFPANEPRPGLWNEMQQNSWNNSYEMQRPMQPNIDYPMQQDQSSNSILSSGNNGLEDPIYGSAEFNPDLNFEDEIQKQVIELVLANDNLYPHNDIFLNPHDVRFPNLNHNMYQNPMISRDHYNTILLRRNRQNLILRNRLRKYQNQIINLSNDDEDEENSLPKESK